MSSAPPTDPGQSVGHAVAAWPRWLGLSGIGFAALMLVVSCCQSLGVFGSRLIPMGELELPEVPAIIKASVVTDTVLTLALGALLLTGAVGTLRLRRAGIRSLRQFAIARLVLVIPLLLLSIAMVRPSVRWTADIARAVVDWKERQGAPVTEAEREATHQQDPTTFQLVMSIAWPLAGGAYPLFLLLFLRRPDAVRELERWDA